MIIFYSLFFILVLTSINVAEADHHNRVNCLLPPKTGPCKGSFARYYFDRETRSCKAFIYGGCQGNSNNFSKKHHCEKRCRAFRYFGSK
uniref:Kunitz-type serine protease inhibitor n=1 Tax=Hadrurus spadix TaxID=141984 RepID=A0A1W7RA92_9SCOR